MSNRAICTDSELIRTGRELHRALRPVNDAILAYLGLTRDDPPRLIAKHEARQRAAPVAHTDRRDGA